MTNPIKAELLANEFITYIFEKYGHARHVRRVASWIGFIIKGISKLPGVSFWRGYSRQLWCIYRGRWFKVRFNHAGKRGGIDILAVLPQQGAPDGKLAMRIRSLADAERAYRSLPQRLDSFIKNNP